MRRFRRRRPKVTWLYSNSTVVDGRENQADFNVTPFTLSLNWDNTQDQVFTVVPLNPFDIPVEPDPTFNVAGTGIPQATLSDIVGSEYVVKRIVGNCYAWAANTSNPNALETTVVLFAAGVFVARADSTNANAPIGADPTLQAGLEMNSAAYNPLNQETQREPWMFRRTWALSSRPPLVNTTQADVGTSIGLAARSFPNTTAGYHGLRTGPFFDIKSARRIRGDERLYLSIAALSVPTRVTPPPTAIENQTVTAIFDLRILGALRRAKAKSNF